MRQNTQIIFQDPYASLNPRLTVEKIVGEPLRIHRVAKGAEIEDRVVVLHTQALLSAVPVPDPRNEKKRQILEGDVPRSISPPSGCHFHTRCIYRTDECSQFEPEFADTGNDLYVACPVWVGGNFL